MARIDSARTISQLQSQLKQLGSAKSVKIDDLPRGKLRDLAELVGPRRTVGSGCNTSRELKGNVTTARLKAAIKRLEADLKRADLNKDNFVSGAETKGLSRQSKDLLGLDSDGNTPVSSSCAF